MSRRNWCGCLVSCVVVGVLAAGTPAFGLPPDKPDLTASAKIDATGFLYIQVGNRGRADVPPGVGTVSVFVDHRRLADYDLTADLPDQIFRNKAGTPEGNSTEFNTGVRLAGKHRRIMVFVDAHDAAHPAGEVDESNEYNNYYSRDWESVRSGYDLSVEAAIEKIGTEERVFFILINKGDIDSPADLPVTFTVRDGATTYTIQRTLPVIPASCEPSNCTYTDCTTGGCTDGACISHVRTCEDYCLPETCATGNTCISASCEIFIRPAEPQKVVLTGLPRSIKVEMTIDVAGLDDLDAFNNTFEAEMQHITAADVDPTDPTTPYGQILDTLNADGHPIEDWVTWPPICHADMSFYTCVPPTQTGLAGWPTSWASGIAQRMPSVEQISDYLLRLEQGRAVPVEQPPAAWEPDYPVSWVYLVRGHGVVDSYLSYLSQQLWFERHAQQRYGIDPIEWADWTVAARKDSEMEGLYLSPSAFIRFWEDDASGGSLERSYRMGVRLVDGGITVKSTPWNAQIMYSFLDHFDLVKPTQWETVEAVTDWWRSYTSHGSTSTDWIRDYDYAGWFPADKVYFPMQSGQKWNHDSQSGCWSTSSVWSATTNAVNIAAFADLSVLEFLPHHRIVLPTVRKPCGGATGANCCGEEYYYDDEALCCTNPPCGDQPGITVYHADDFYQYDFVTWGADVGATAQIVPGMRLWYSRQEDEFILNGTPCDCEDGSECLTCDCPSCSLGVPYDPDCGGRTCNAEGEQRTFNHERQKALTFMEFAMPRWLLKRCCDRKCQVAATCELECGVGNCQTCSGSPCIGSCNGLEPSIDWEAMALPMLSDPEKQAVRDRLDAVIDSLGPVDDVADWLWDMSSPADLGNFDVPSQVNSAPSVTAVSIPQTYPGYTVELKGTASDSDGPNPLQTLWWCDHASAVIADDSALNTTVSLPGVAGDVTCTLLASDGVDMASASVTVSVMDPADGPVLVWNEGSRYFAITPWTQSPSQSVAIRVTLEGDGVGCLGRYVSAVGGRCLLGSSAEFHTVTEWTNACTAWPNVLPLYVTGSEIVGLTTGTVRLESPSGDLSTSDTATTNYWADVAPVYYPETAQPDFNDITAVTRAFTGYPPSGVIYTYDLVGLTSDDCLPEGIVSFLDQAEVIAAFSGNPLDCSQPPPLTVCDPAQNEYCDFGVCVACITDAHCGGQMCCDNVCQDCCNDTDCDDGVFCNGAETCSGGSCVAGTAPNCDDGQYCTGTESCDPVLDQCVSSGDPCGTGEVCNEATNSCDTSGCSGCNNVCCNDVCCPFAFQICCNGVCKSPFLCNP